MKSAASADRGARFVRSMTPPQLRNLIPAQAIPALRGIAVIEVEDEMASPWVVANLPIIEHVFRVLNMSSTKSDDRTTQARIRDAAIKRVAGHGLAALTARGVAEDAGVSPGSVIHHFGSMEALREACDHEVAAVVSRRKMEAVEKGEAYDPVESLKQHGEDTPVARYLAAVAVSRTPSVDRLVDELVDDAVIYTGRMVEAGLMKPSADPRGRAVLLVLQSLGNLILADHMERLLGVDITRPPKDPREAAAYMRPMLEIMHQGIMTDASLEMMKEAFVGDEGEAENGKE